MKTKRTYDHEKKDNFRDQTLIADDHGRHRQESRQSLIDQVFNSMIIEFVTSSYLLFECMVRLANEVHCKMYYLNAIKRVIRHQIK